MRDLIDRQDTIDICDVAIDLWNGQFGCGALVAIKDKILELPSAQPEPCEDMISREYLKEHIEVCWINGRPRYAPELNELLSWIDDVPSAQSEPQWIPCSERLPEKWGDYLVTIKWKGIYSGDFYTETKMSVYDNRAKEWDCNGVIAWMPLPKPYRGDNND